MMEPVPEGASTCARRVQGCFPQKYFAVVPPVRKHVPDIIDVPPVRVRMFLTNFVDYTAWQ